VIGGSRDSFTYPTVGAKCSRRLEVGRSMELFSDSFLVVGWLVDEVLRNYLQVSATDLLGYRDEGGSICDYTPTLKSVRAQNIMCMIKYTAKMQVRCSL